MLSTFHRTGFMLLDSFAIAVMALSIGLATMTMLMVFVLIVTLGFLVKLKSWILEEEE